MYFNDVATNGGGFEEGAMIGPLVSERQMQRVLNDIQTGESEGGRIATGGGRVGETGYYVQPAVITETNNDMPVIKEGIFGPVLVTQKFSDIDEVISLANDSEYGLSSAV